MNIGNWLWQWITKEWIKRPACSEGVRKIAVGLIHSGPCYLHWWASNPSVAASAASISNTILGGGAIELDAFASLKDTVSQNLNPPMYFSVGIYLETFTNLTAITFGISY